jgi:hypothetical protein
MRRKPPNTLETQARTENGMKTEMPETGIHGLGSLADIPRAEQT